MPIYWKEKTVLFPNFQKENRNDNLKLINHGLKIALGK